MIYNIAHKFVWSNSIVWACFIFLLCMLKNKVHLHAWIHMSVFWPIWDKIVYSIVKCFPETKLSTLKCSRGNINPFTTLKPSGWKCYKTIVSYLSCVFIEIWSTWKVWRALKKLELLLAMPRATLKHLSCSPNFLHASYLHEHTLTYEPIVNWQVQFQILFYMQIDSIYGSLNRNCTIIE